MSSANVELVRSIFAAWERGDFSAGDWAAPDIELVRVDGPAPGNWRGSAEIAGGVREMLSAWDEFRLIADQYHELEGVTGYSYSTTSQRAASGVDSTPGSWAPPVRTYSTLPAAR